MAAIVYASFLNDLLEADIDFINDTINVILIDTTEYTPQQDDIFLSEIPAAARVATVTLAGKSIQNGGALLADNSVFAGLVDSPACDAVVIYKHTGDEATSPLVIYIDSADLDGLPTTAGATEIEIEWSGVIRVGTA